MEWDEIEPCRGVREMFQRLSKYEGIPLGILADKESKKFLDCTYDNNPTPWMSLGNWHANLIEKILGEPPNNRQGRDLHYAEIKVIPVEMPKNKSRKYTKWPAPQEDTKICSFNYNDLIDNSFKNSNIYKKLTSIIFIPIQRKSGWKHPEKIDYESMYMVNSFMWIPNEDILREIENEYNQIRNELIRQINTELKFKELSNGTKVLDIELNSGIILDPRTGGGSKGTSTSNIIIKNKKFKVKQKSWFLKKSLTYKIMQYVMFGE